MVQWFLIPGFFWPFVALFVLGVLTVFLEEGIAKFNKRVDNFFTGLFLLGTLWIVREYVERGHVWITHAPWILRDAAVVIIVGAMCLLALGLGRIAGKTVVGFFRIVLIIEEAFGRGADTLGQFLRRWVFGPFVRVMTPVVRVLRRAWLRRRAA